MLSIVHLEGSEVGRPPSPSSRPSEQAEPPSPVFERVDPYTLYVFDQLFPGRHGLRILAGLLRQASVKQLALPELGLVDASDVAVVTAQNLRLLSRLVGIGYDTLEKYIVVLDRLRLLYKKRFRRQIELYFPLRRYHLPEPGVLDEIQALRPKSQKYRYRPKVREFAESVKRRFVLLRPVHSDKPGTISSSVNQGHQQLPEAIMNEIRQILHQEVDSEVEHRLLPRIERVIAYHCTHSQSRISRAKDDSELDMSQLELPPPSPKGDFVTVSSPQEHSQSRPLGQKDDFQRDKPSYESRPLMQKGNFEAAGDGSESPSFSPKGDFSHIRSPHDASERRLFEDTDASSLEKSHFFDAKDDSHCTETQDTFANVNVLSFRTYINVNVRLVASLCCHALNEPSTKRGIYLKLFRECNLDADAIAGALLYTLVHRQNGTMRKPPAVFMKLCREYHHTGIPHETRHLMQRYGELSYHRLLTEVNQVPAPVVHHAPSLEQGQRGKEYPRVAAAHSPDAALTQAVALSPAHEKPLALHIPLRSDGGMRQDDALQLRAMLAHDRRLGLCRTALIVLEDGSYGVLVDNTITNTIRQVVFYSVQQWQERSLTFKSGHELFTDGSEGKRVLHPLRLWRQHHYPQQEQEA